MLQIIEKKKMGRALSDAEISAWVKGVCDRSIPDYQSAALLMAIRLMGMTPEETTNLTMAMRDSGKKIDFSRYGFVLDKHSTGGVGDKVTLILAPILAALGLPVAMLSGRGLGFTGGTIDKLESLTGVCCDLDEGTFFSLLETVGWTNSQPTPDLVPADRILYALRDVTGTVDSIPLITASIMSKKLAGGASHLCLDVKCGQAAFMQKIASAKALFKSLQSVGRQANQVVTGMVSRMEEPLGRAIGNYVELLEAVLVLRRPEYQSNLWQVTETMAVQMMAMSPSFKDLRHDPATFRNKIREVVERGFALEKLVKYLEATGADPKALDQLLRAKPHDWEPTAIPAPEQGRIAKINGRKLAELARNFGAGRFRKEDDVDPMAGMYLHVSLGDPVDKGQPLLSCRGKIAQEDRQALLKCFTLVEGDQAIEPPPAILFVDTEPA
jgi:pyrimidine-nucleoside phosphorylase